uniref:SDR family oxidoreductase n=1 Tax=Phenylobacterium glaciei TaxID=2803784 RepID=A0A974S7W6_9CAUL|nr:SDR family oxidoreductase [Phenylobacterium glaciei]
MAYEVSKAAVNRLTTSVAQSNAAKGVRCNAIMPGLMDTPWPWPASPRPAARSRKRSAPPVMQEFR